MNIKNPKNARLWTAENDALMEASSRSHRGIIEANEYEQIKFWIKNGFVIFRNAINPELIDEVNSEISNLIESSGVYVDFFDAGRKYCEWAKPEYMGKNEAKLLDCHMASNAVQKLIFSKIILRFMDLIFAETPLAFQTLTFKYGSQQQIHSDLAFVPVDHPHQFIASWIALEDVTEGAGELQYYPGSQKIKPYIWNNGSIWNAPGEEKGAYRRSMHRTAAEHKLKLISYYPRKGDVLMWSSGLYHGGAKRTKPNLTRKSIVTHYCPANCMPMHLESREDIIDTGYGGLICGKHTPRA